MFHFKLFHPQQCHLHTTSLTQWHCTEVPLSCWGHHPEILWFGDKFYFPKPVPLNDVPDVMSLPHDVIHQGCCMGLYHLSERSLPPPAGMTRRPSNPMCSAWFRLGPWQTLRCFCFSPLFPQFAIFPCVRYFFWANYFETKPSWPNKFWIQVGLQTMFPLVQLQDCNQYATLPT